jgi:hypothetical protein
MKAAIELAVRLAAAPRTDWSSPHARGLAVPDESAAPAAAEDDEP